MTMLPPGEKEEGLTTIINELREAEAFTSTTSKKLNKIELTIMILSVITSGALWLLISNVFNQLMVWIGAIISTIVTGLTIYMEMSQLKKKRIDGLRLRRELMNFLAELRSGAMDDDAERYWRDLKRFQDELKYLKTP
jgi:hypothetical protein